MRYAFEFARRRKLYASMHERQVERPNLRARSVAARFRRGSSANIPKSKPATSISTICWPQMVRDPSQFQVIVTCNLFGDIASDLGAELAGGLGLAASGNIHPGQVSLFEPVHGSRSGIERKRPCESHGGDPLSRNDVRISGVDAGGEGDRNGCSRCDCEGKVLPPSWAARSALARLATSSLTLLREAGT